MSKLLATLRARLGKPSVLTTGLAVLAGVLAYLNLRTFGFGEPWSTLVTAGLVSLSGLGISPLTGPALQNALHISYKKALAISSALTTAAVGLTTVDVNPTLRSVLVALLTAVGGMLVGPRAPAPPPAATRPRARPRSTTPTTPRPKPRSTAKPSPAKPRPAKD